MATLGGGGGIAPFFPFSSTNPGFQYPTEKTASANVNALLGVWAAVSQHSFTGIAIQSSPRTSVWYLCADGSIQTYTVEQDCNFVGCSAPGGGELFVTTQMTTPSEPVGGTSGVRPNLIGYSFTPGYAMTLSRTPLSAGTKLFFNVNSGPRLIVLVFEPR